MAYSRKDGSPRPWLIYMLEDPLDGSVRYIGKVIELKNRIESYDSMANRRLREHIGETKKARSYRKLSWIRCLIAEGRLPVIHIAEAGAGSGCVEAEIRWISTGHALGLDLVNSTKGGIGTIGWVHSEEVKDRIRRAKTGVKKSLETCQKISASKRGPRPNRRGERRSLEARQKMSESRKGRPGRPISEEVKKKISEANRGRQHTLEARQKMSAARKGKGLATPEMRARLSHIQKEVQNRPEVIEKQRAAHQRKKSA